MIHHEIRKEDLKAWDKFKIKLALILPSAELSEVLAILEKL